jgi:hypothetical protein
MVCLFESITVSSFAVLKLFLTADYTLADFCFAVNTFLMLLTSHMSLEFLSGLPLDPNPYGGVIGAVASCRLFGQPGTGTTIS